MTTGSSIVHHLKELSYDECLSVFCQHALGTKDFNQHLDVKAIGEEIVKRCKGLPLAAKALGGLLRGKSNVDSWKEVLESKIWDSPSNKSNILPALGLSYLYLPPHLKRCFAYGSIFPKDYEFDRNELVLLWMAEGFLSCDNKVKQREDLGHQYFQDLLSRSFFQQSNCNKSRYIMHDLINDLAHFVSRDTCFHLIGDESPSASHASIRHAAFIGRRYNISKRFRCFNGMGKLRTFLSLQEQSDYDRSYLSRKVLYELLPILKCLRVLSLTNYNFQELPSCVGELKQLRYIDLPYSDITKLPESMGKLFHLETLKLNSCRKLLELPKNICNLTKLLYLDISETHLTKMPPQIGNLTSLHMLSKFSVGRGRDGLKISELNKLSQLAGKFDIEELQNVTNISDENFVKGKAELQELYLKWDYPDFGNRMQKNSNRDEQILKSLEPHQHLSCISIRKFGGRQFPSWVGNPIFTKMVKLQLFFCENIKSLPPLG